MNVESGYELSNLVVLNGILNKVREEDASVSTGRVAHVNLIMGLCLPYHLLYAIPKPSRQTVQHPKPIWKPGAPQLRVPEHRHRTIDPNVTYLT